jgi:two-component system response regulator PilR (NtrC family)
LDLMINYSWPGNIRELENVVERAVALEKGEFVAARSLPSELVFNISDGDAKSTDIDTLLQDGELDFTQYIDDVSRKILLKAFRINDSNMKKTADMLKLNYRSLRYLMEKYQLKQK